MIFISYRKEDSSDFALSLADKLIETFGEASVFLDRHQIEPGDHWREKIDRALSNAVVVLAVIGPRWLKIADEYGKRRIDRDDDVLAYELSVALQRGIMVIPLYLHGLKPLPEKAFPSRLVGLANQQGIEFDIVRDISSLLATFEKMPNLQKRDRSQESKEDDNGLPPPEEFRDVLDKKRAHFCGRQWVFDEVDKWIADRSLPALVITGEPGTGKSAFIAEFSRRNRDLVLACHCCEAQRTDLLRPARFAHNIAALIAQRLPEYAQRVAHDEKLARWKAEANCSSDPISAFRSLVIEPLKTLRPPNGTTWLLLVDALDESLAVQSESKTIVDVLAATLEWFPEWLGLIATSRTRPPKLRTLSREIRMAARNDGRNLEDIDKYVALRLKELKLAARLARSGVSAGDVSCVLSEKSDGNFLYVQQALEGIELELYDFKMLNELPPGLSGHYLRWFEWQFRDEAAYEPAKVLFQCIFAAKEPLSRALLSQVTGLGEEDELPRILSRLSEYLPKRDGVYTLYHQSLGEWLVSPEILDDCPRYYVSLQRGRKQMADCGWRLFTSGSTALADYFKRYLPQHLIETDRWDELRDVLADLDLFEHMWKHGWKYEWMRYWQALREQGQYDPGKAYEQALNALIDREGESECVSGLADLVGCFLRDMGENQFALPFMDRARRLSEEIYGKEHPETATRLHNLGELYRLLKEPDKALPLLEEALRVRELLYVGDHPDIATSLHKLGEFHHDTGHSTGDKLAYETALKYYEQALEIRDRTLDANHPERADCIHDIGVAYMQLGRRAFGLGQRSLADQQYNKALSQFDQAKAIYDAAYGAGNPESATADLNLGTICWYRYEFPNAVELGRKALAEIKRTLSEHHEKVRTAFWYLSAVLRSSGKYAESLEYAKEQARLTMETLGAENPDSRDALLTLTATYAAAGKLSEARACLRSHLNIGKTLTNEDRLKLAERQMEVVNLCVAWAVVSGAIALCEEVIKLQEEVYGLQHLELCPAIESLSRLYQVAKRNDDAVAAINRLLEIRRSSLETGNIKVAETVLRLATHYEANCEYDLAEREYRRVVALREQAIGPDHNELIAPHSLLAKHYESRLQHDLAEREYRRVVALCEQSLGADNLQLIPYLSTLARYYQSTSQHELAECEYRRVVTVCDRSRGADHVGLCNPLGLLKDYYDKTIRYAEAAVVGERILAICRLATDIPDSELATALNNLGFSYVRMGCYVDAQEVLTSSLELYGKLDVADRDIAPTLNNLAEAHLGLGSYAEAEAPCRKALSIRENEGDPKRLAVSQTTWGTLLYKRSQFDEAEKWFKSALENHDRATQAPCHYRLETLQRYLELLRALGRDSDAEEWQKRTVSERTKLTGQVTAMNKVEIES